MDEDERGDHITSHNVKVKSRERRKRRDVYEDQEQEHKSIIDLRE